MHSVSMPAIDLLSTIPQVLAVEAEVRANCELAFARLWSWTARYGDGPHPAAAIERVVRWDGDGGVFARALVLTGWADEASGGVIIRPWQDVLGYADPVPANETPEERRRRQKRESMRRSRASGRDTKLHAPSAIGGVDMRGHPVDKRGHLVDIGGHFVDVRGQNVDICGPGTPPSRTRSLSLSTSLKYSEEEPEAEGEQNTEVGVAAGASTVMAVRSASEGHAFSASGEAGGQTSLFAPVAVSPSARPAASGQERPAIASGSTIGVEVRSVPVPASDRSPERNSGGRGKRGRGGKKAAVDPQTVEGPIRQVWTAYAEVVGGRVVLSRERAELIADRLADGWTADDLVEAVRGFAKSAWHFGANDRGTRFTTIELWLRDSAHVEQGLGFHKEAAKAVVTKAGDPIKNPPRGGFEEKFAKYFEEKRRKEAEQAAKEHA